MNAIVRGLMPSAILHKVHSTLSQISSLSLTTNAGSTYRGQMTISNQTSSSSLPSRRKKIFGKKKDTTTQRQLLPHGYGVACYAVEDNPLISVYAGQWDSAGRWHGIGQITLPKKGNEGDRFLGSFVRGRLHHIIEETWRE